MFEARHAASLVREAAPCTSSGAAPQNVNASNGIATVPRTHDLTVLVAFPMLGSKRDMGHLFLSSVLALAGVLFGVDPCPNIQITTPADGAVSGSPLLFAFTVSPDITAVQCATDPQAPQAFDCIPGIDNEIFFGAPGSGYVSAITLYVTAQDSSSVCTESVTVDVDVKGPNASLSVLCDALGEVCQPPPGHFDAWGTYVVDGQVCPSSTPATEIRFTGSDQEGHGPVRFMCQLDGGSFRDCSDGPGSGVLRWGQGSLLPDGQHAAVIVGYDALGNPGPMNFNAPGNFGIVVTFTVGACTRCGDGFVWAGVETCDDGNTVNTDACPNTCQSARCGDGFLWAGVETCDDGNTDDTDGCPTTCLDATCGDGFVRKGVEQCDEGSGNSDTGPCSPQCISNADADVSGCGCGVTPRNARRGESGTATLWLIMGLVLVGVRRRGRR